VGRAGRRPLNVAGRKTNAVRLLEQEGIRYELRAYELSLDEFTAARVAELVGLPAAQVFKTLAVQGDRTGPCLAVVPGDADLDLKALAAERRDRKAALAPLHELESLTGYRRGAVTALGTRKRLPVVLDDSATGFDRIAVSAGVKGLQVLVDPHDYVTVTGASLAAIARRD
jgi:Cys-tRNA(Pro)/Cys-tRNA(Cys) deacylase